MEENKPINNSEEAKPPDNPQDALHGQQLSNPSTDEPIATAEISAEVEQPQTTNHKPQTTNLKLKIWKYTTTPTPLMAGKTGKVISGSF